MRINAKPFYAALVRVLLIAGVAAAFATPAPLQAISKAQETPDSVIVYTPLAGIRQLATGWLYACALTTAGGVKCWGANHHGQIGDNTQNTDRLTPVDVVGLSSGVVAIAAGGEHTCALTAAGGVECWGNNNNGQIGDNSHGTDRLKPTKVVSLSSGVVAISAGGAHTCALTTADIVWCWGSNFNGQIGDNAKGTDRYIPTGVQDLSNVVAMSAGGEHTCALTTAGGVKCWGDNSYGAIGDNTKGTDRPTPTAVQDLSSVVAIAAGGSHTCALTTVGGVKCWGDNFHGQIGDNFVGIERLKPTNVVDLSSGVIAIAAGGLHTCAVLATGKATCWGFNNYGQTGNGAPGPDRLRPVAVLGLTGALVAVGAGNYYSCALTIAGGVQCWGDNALGELGDHSVVARPVAGDVLVPATCYALTLSHSGDGSNPSPTPGSSPGCPPNNYLAGTLVALVAGPVSSSFVQSWSGTNSNQSHDPANLLTMPSADHEVSVTYGLCRTLIASHTGNGANPVAVPSQSSGCVPGKYAAGEILTLVAAPGAEQRVQSWIGATQAPGDGTLVNTLTMPDSNKTVSVAYEPCVGLTATIQGQGELLQVTPSATQGCDPTSYVAGQIVTLLAAPAPGWHVAGWSGTANNQSTAVSNSVMIGAKAATAGVIYQQIDGALFLPSVER